MTEVKIDVGVLAFLLELPPAAIARTLSFLDEELQLILQELRQHGVELCLTHGTKKVKKPCGRCGRSGGWCCPALTKATITKTCRHTREIEDALRDALECLECDDKCYFCFETICEDCTSPRNCVGCFCAKFCYGECADEMCPCERLLFFVAEDKNNLPPTP
jgi:hypothetical protein